MKNLEQPNLDRWRSSKGNIDMNKIMSFETTMSHGTFSNQENGIIARVVQQVTYGKGEHDVKGENGKLTSLAMLAKELTIKKGEATQASIKDFLDAGYNDFSLNELMAKVAIRSTTHFLFGNLDYEDRFSIANS